MIVVTGGAGFIGSALVWGLNQRNLTDILVVDTAAHTGNCPNLSPLRFADYVERDLFIEQLEQGCFDDRITGILHMGACSSTTEQNEEFLMRNNYQYTRRLAQWCVAHDARFVYASSAATYGDGSRGFSDDHSQLASLEPLNLYGLSKQRLDLWAQQEGLLDRIAGLKYFNVFGPNEYHKKDMRSVVHKAHAQIAEQGKVTLFKSHRDDYEDGWQLRDFVYVKDAVAATLAIYDDKHANGIFNVGTGRARSFYDLALAVFTALKKEPTIEFIDMPEIIRDRYQYYTQADVTKLRTILPDGGHTLEQAVTDYVCNYLTPSQQHLSPTLSA